MGDLTLFEALTGGAFDRLNWQHSGEFDQNFKKKSNAPGFARGGDGRFWNWLVHKRPPSIRILGGRLRKVRLYFCIRLNEERQKKKFFVWATFDFFLRNFWATFWEITGNFLGNLEQLVESPSPVCTLKSHNKHFSYKHFNLCIIILCYDK